MVYPITSSRCEIFQFSGLISFQNRVEPDGLYAGIGNRVGLCRSTRREFGKRYFNIGCGGALRRPSNNSIFLCSLALMKKVLIILIT